MSRDWREGKKPVILITGYLGSGKTTLMQHLLSQEQRKIALGNTAYIPFFKAR